MPKILKQSATPRTAPSPNGSGSSGWDMIAALRTLLYGQSGTGKTTTAATWPGPILWLICSGGNKPGELRSVDTPENRKKIRPEVLNSSDQLRDLLEEAKEYTTTVLDHVSGLQDLILKEILGIDEIPAQKGWGLATQQQYGQCTMQAKEILRTMLNLPGNVIVIAQERTFGGKDDGVDPELIKPTVGPAVTPSLCGWLAPACDYTMQMFKRPRIEKVKMTVAGTTTTQTKRLGGVEYCARCEAHDVFMTKFRVPKGHYLPDVIPDPSYDKIQAVLDGTYKAKYEAPPTKK